MSATITITDQALVARFDELVHAKLAEAEQLPDAIQGCHCEKGHSFGIFVLSGPDDAVEVTHDSGGYHQLMFANDTVPAYNVRHDGGALVVDFEGDLEQLPDLSAQLDLADGLAIMLSELVPYGWAKEGKIIAVVYGSEVDTVEMNGMTVNAHGIDCYVLEGQELPEELKMGEDTKEWAERVWQLIQQDKLVRLTDRINNLPEEVWAKSDGIHQPWLEFEANDGQLPAFVTGQRYVFWHPMEKFPEQVLSGARAEAGAQNPLRGWFR